MSSSSKHDSWKNGLLNIKKPRHYRKYFDKDVVDIRGTTLIRNLLAQITSISTPIMKHDLLYFGMDNEYQISS